MYQVTKKLTLILVLASNLILAACGGSSGSSGAGATVADNVSINGTAYIENGTSLRLDTYLLQTSTSAYQYGGPMAVITMNDTTSGNSLFYQVLSTASGWPGVYNLVGTGTNATITDKSVSTGGLMQDLDNLSGGYGSTGGSISINTFGDVGQPVTGSFNLNLCDKNAVCSASIKNYTGTFSVTRTANYGSLARPAPTLTPTPAGANYSGGIHPATGKNHYSIPTNATGGTLTLTLTPTVDVNMAVFTDAGFTTPATCNITSTLSVVGNGVETCAITVTANQRLYVTVSQAAAATALETYTLRVAE